MREKTKEKVLTLIESLKREQSAVILVEGIRDCRVLRAFGIECTIEKVSGKRLFDFLVSERFQGKNVIILTDFDRRGCELFRRIRNELEALGLNPNCYYWQQLKTLLKGEVKGIEELKQIQT